MAVNPESTNKEIEKQKEIGKQKDGSLVAAENDWCLNFVSNLPWADTNNALRCGSCYFNSVSNDEFSVKF